MKKAFLLLFAMIAGMGINSMHAQIATTVTATNLLCNGDSTGTIAVQVLAPNSTYQYKLDTAAWQPSNIFDSLWADTFMVYVMDTLGGIDSIQQVLTEPQGLTLTLLMVQDLTCPWSCNGQLTVAATGGTMPYTYFANGMMSFSGPQIQNLCAGTYTLQSNDANGCTAIAMAVVQQPPPLILSAFNVVNATCGLQNDGSFQLMPSGGNFGYTFVTWPTGNTSVNPNNLSAGTYTATVVDGLGCTATTTVTITQNNGLQLTSLAIDRLNYDACDTTPSFQLVAQAIPNSSSYTYEWTTNGNIISTNDTTSALTNQGIYYVQVTDTNGCVYNANDTIINASLTVTASLDTICSGQQSTLTAVYSGTSSYPVYCYPPNTSGLSFTVAPIATTTYTLVTADPNYCADTVYKTIVVRDTNFTSTVSFLGVAPTCTYANDGAAYVLSSPNNTNLAYAWNTNATSSLLPNLVGSLYSVFVTEGNACLFHEFNLVPTNANCGTISGQIKLDANADCLGQSTEQNIPNVLVNVSGINISALTTATGNYSISGIPYGTYTVSQATLPTGVLIACPAPAPVTLSSTNTIAVVDFVDTSDGIVNYSILYVGNTCLNPFLSPIRYLHFQQVGLANASSAVVYAVFDTITHYNSSVPAHSAISGDTVFWNVTVQAQYNNIAMQFNVPPLGTPTMPFSYGFHSTQLFDQTQINNHDIKYLNVCQSYDPNNKEVSPQGLTSAGYITPSDSVLTYTINFQNTGTAPAINVILQDVLSANIDASSLEVLIASHSYMVNITNGNQLAFSFPNIMLPDSNANEPLSHGYITYRVHTNAAVGATINNTAAIYFDGNDPVITNTTVNTVYQPYINSTTSIGGNTQCNTTCGTGSVAITNNGGIAPFTYTVNPNCGSLNITGNTISNLASGNYTISATDVIGESYTLLVTVPNPPSINLSASATQVYCSYDSSMVTATATGGTGTLSTTINGTALQTQIQLPAGIYTLQTTDAGTCSTTFVLTVTAPSAVQQTNTLSSILCNGDNAQLNVTPSGGITPHEIFVNGTYVVGAQNLSAGNYTISVRDAYFCSTSSIITITEPAALQISSISAALVGATFEIGVTAIGGTGSYNYKVYKLIGANYVLQGSYASQPLPAATTGIYKVEVYDVNGCLTQQLITIEALGINSNNVQASVSASPNPFTEFINIKLSTHNAAGNEVSMYDATGRQIYAAAIASDEFKIDTKNFASGVYWLRINNETIKMLK